VKASNGAAYKHVGANPAAADLNQGIPENNFIHTLFSDVRVLINNTLVESANGLSHYKQYIPTFLGCSSKQSRNRLQLSLYDLNGYSADYKTVETNVSRQSDTTNSSVFSVMSQVNLDIQKQAKGFLPHSKIKLQFILNNKERYCYFDVGKDGIVKFSKFQIITKMVKMKDFATVSLMRRLQNEPIVYNVPTIQMSNYNLNKEINEHEFHNVFTHVLPNFCLIAFVENDAFLGVGSKSVFEFKPFKITHLSIHNQNIVYPQISGYNFSNDNFKEVYYNLFHDLEIQDIYGLTIANMVDGRMIFPFDLTKTGHFPSHTVHDFIPANASIKVKWSEAPTENVTMVVCSFFERRISVDKYGQTIVLEI
jgi:hypothetical protein